MHPVVGADVVERIPGLQALAPIIRHHHQNWDGSGYPDRIGGADIPIGARIIAVAEAFGAMTTTRSYRAASSPGWTMAELRRQAGAQFDPAVVQAKERVIVVDPIAIEREAA
jgi:HD-GYP domain-containing protein (c-di-GMP phosphodiesterase class II)